MAFPQSDLPPSMAPTARARTRALAAPARPDYSRLIARLLFALAVTAVLALLGIAAARATESFAVGIMAADLVFLLGVAAWSAVYVGGRR